MEDAKQGRFPWATPAAIPNTPEVVLEPETIERVITLMARALIAVVRAAAEADHER